MLALWSILMIPVLFVMGKATLRILYGSRRRAQFFWEDGLLTGGILLIGLAEAAHLGAMVRGRSVSASVKLFPLLLMGMFLLSVSVLILSFLKDRRQKDSLSDKDRRPDTTGEGATYNGACRPGFFRVSAFFEKPWLFELLALIPWAILVGWQLYRILGGYRVYLDRDMTLETVQAFLGTDRLYEWNPMTGLPYQEGIPSRLKILCLPTFYATLCRLLGTAPELLIWHVVPVWVLLAAYLAYWSLARVFFPDSGLWRGVFLGLTALLFCVGDSMYGLEGFGLLHGGFQGVTIRGAVLIPYLFGLCLRRKWRLAVPVILAEACIVWTTYGLGMGVLVMAAVAALRMGCRLYTKRKEGSKWGNS